jgi:hypothetical protein
MRENREVLPRQGIAIQTPPATKMLRALPVLFATDNTSWPRSRRTQLMELHLIPASRGRA